MDRAGTVGAAAAAPSRKGPAMHEGSEDGLNQRSAIGVEVEFEARFAGERR